MAVQGPTSTTTTSPAVGPLVSPRPLRIPRHALRLSLPLGQLPILARCLGHLAIALIVLFVIVRPYSLALDAPTVTWHRPAEAAAARPGPVSSAAVAPRPADQVLEAAVLLDGALHPRDHRADGAPRQRAPPS